MQTPQMELRKTFRGRPISCWRTTHLHWFTTKVMRKFFVTFPIAVREKVICRTCTSSLREFEQCCSSHLPNIVYKKQVAGMKSTSVGTTPRNMKQLCNLRYKHLNQRRISRDALYNKHELAYDIPGFIRKITTYPDLVCICGLQEILEEANKVLQLKSPSQLLSYDTTFKLGDFYVSPLLFKKVTCGFTMNFDIETGEFIHYIAHWSGALDDCDNNWH